MLFLSKIFYRHGEVLLTGKRNKSNSQRQCHCSVEDDALVQLSVDRWRACYLVNLVLVCVFGHLAVIITKFADGNKQGGCIYCIGWKPHIQPVKSKLCSVCQSCTKHLNWLLLQQCIHCTVHCFTHTYLTVMKSGVIISIKCEMLVHPPKESNYANLQGW